MMEIYLCNFNFVGFCHCGSIMSDLSAVYCIYFHGWTVQGCFYALQHVLSSYMSDFCHSVLSVLANIIKANALIPNTA